MTTFAALKKNLSTDTSRMPAVRVALLADSSTQFLSIALRGAAVERGLNLQVFEAPYRQIAGEALDPNSALYAFRPDFTIIWQTSERLLSAFQETAPGDRGMFADRRVAEVDELVTAIAATARTKVLCLNAVAIDDGVFGSFATSVPESWVYQLRRYDYELMELAARRGDLLLVDLALLAAQHDRAFVSDTRLAATMDVQLSLDFLPLLSNRILEVIDAARGRVKKCLILDLDNTLWGGVIGDDGMDRIEIGELGIGHIFDEIQAWARALKERGIVLAVASKNDSRIAAEPFERHPDMTLTLADIAVFGASWDEKAATITHIQSVLEIGFDSMVFLDDNPAERAAVRLRLPEVCVPELPEDPAEWLPMLRGMNLFETASYTRDDADRTRQYQQEAERQSTRASFADSGEFLRSLEMVGTIAGFTGFNVPRVAQLTQRSNQFNLRTVRYDEAEIASLAASAKHVCLAVTLADRFGSHGLISVLILSDAGEETYFVDTWLMSCRVLQRGVEAFALNAACAAVRVRGGARIVGEYIPTAKNALVKDHYRSLGFSDADGRWCLSLDRFVELSHSIRTGDAP